jgi:hypothetical protein
MRTALSPLSDAERPTGFFSLRILDSFHHFFVMESNTLALTGYGFIVLAGAMNILRWRKTQRTIEKLDRPSEADGHRRAAERDEAWYSTALAVFDEPKY